MEAWKKEREALTHNRALRMELFDRLQTLRLEQRELYEKALSKAAEMNEKGSKLLKKNWVRPKAHIVIAQVSAYYAGDDGDEEGNHED